VVPLQGGWQVHDERWRAGPQARRQRGHRRRISVFRREYTRSGQARAHAQYAGSNGAPINTLKQLHGSTSRISADIVAKLLELLELLELLPDEIERLRDYTDLLRLDILRPAVRQYEPVTGVAI